MANPIAYYPTTPRFARSPIFISVTKGAAVGDGLINATLTLRIFSGDNTTTPAVDYTLYKESIDDGRIDFEISDLIREKIVAVLKTTTTGTSEASTTEGVWCKFLIDGNWVDAGTPNSGLILSNTSFLNTDGWALFSESNATTIGRMVTGRTLYVAEGLDYAMPVYLPSRTYFFYRNPGGSWSVAGNITPGTQSSSRIAYFPYGKDDAAIYAGAASPSIALGDVYEIGFGTDGATPQITYRVEVLCEPKYTPIRVSFINRYGVVDYITFFKTSTRSGDFSSSQYMPQLTTSAIAGPDISQAMQTKTYDRNSKETITLNTGWVDENYDNIIRELLLSEIVSMYWDGTEVTVIPQTQSVQYQKHINDKNINYSVSFVIAWNIRNDVR